MDKRKNILALNGSASGKSTNLELIKRISELAEDKFDLDIFEKLTDLPHFNPELSIEGTPKKVTEFRNAIKNADGILICTPEYVFSIPSGLKNAIEWCVSTTVFSKKPVGLVTASASGEKAHEELKLIMKTIETDFTDETTLLIQGLKGKIDQNGTITDIKMKNSLVEFISAFTHMLEKPAHNKELS